jgi:hypothetical protein
VLKTHQGVHPDVGRRIDFSRRSKLERIEIFRYNEICFGSAEVVARIAAQIGVSIDPAKVLRPFRGHGLIGQFNKGAALRREMSPNQEAVL